MYHECFLDGYVLFLIWVRNLVHIPAIRWNFDGIGHVLISANSVYVVIRLSSSH